MTDRVPSQPTSPPDPGGGPQGRRNQNRGRNSNTQRNNEDEEEGNTPEIKGVYRLKPSNDPSITYGSVTQKIAEYVAKLKGGGDYRLGLVNLKMPDIDEPDDTKAKAKDANGERDLIEVDKWRSQYKIYEAKMFEREEAQKVIFAIVLGQCTRALRTKMEADEEYDDINIKHDVMGLMKLIRANAFTNGIEGNFMVTGRQAEIAFTNLRQSSRMSLDTYHRTFLDLLANFERLVGRAGIEERRVEL